MVDIGKSRKCSICCTSIFTCFFYHLLKSICKSKQNKLKGRSKLAISNRDEKIKTYIRKAERSLCFKKIHLSYLKVRVEEKRERDGLTRMHLSCTDKEGRCSRPLVEFFKLQSLCMVILSWKIKFYHISQMTIPK